MKGSPIRYILLMFAEIILYALAGVSAIMLFVHLVLFAGVLFNRLRDIFPAESPPGDRPETVSVIVAAKDEEDNLPRLLASLEDQSVSDFELVLVNDRSLDRTGEIMEAFKIKHKSRVKVIHNRQAPSESNPKQFALDLALSASSGEILIFSDSDCVLPPGWVEHTLRYFADPRTGIVFGQLFISPQSNFLERYQGFDQPLINQYSSGSAGLGIPTGCFGNNLAARKAAIEEIGGFKALGYTVTEDAALISTVARRKWKVRVSTLLETVIETRPKTSWREFINQHVRWNSGGFYSEDLITRLGYRTIVLYLVVSIGAFPLSFFLSPLLLMLPVTSFISIGLLALISGLLYRADKLAFLLRLVPYTLFFMIFYSFITVLTVFKVSPEWKGRKLKSAQVKRV